MTWDDLGPLGLSADTHPDGPCLLSPIPRDLSLALSTLDMEEPL